MDEAKQETLSVVYRGILIMYDEASNKFTFTLRNRNRFANSLFDAKAAIDKPVKDKSEFKRFNAWFNGRWGSSGFAQVEVTSLSDSRNSWEKEPKANIVFLKQDRMYSRHQRLQCNLSDLYPCNERNDALVAEMQKLHEQADALVKSADKLKSKLMIFKAPKED